MNKNVGIVAIICASLVGLSTLFTKQHYVLDVIGGVLLAGVAYVVFLRGYRRERIPDLERRLAPVFALCVIGVVAVGIAVFWIAYQLSVPA